MADLGCVSLLLKELNESWNTIVAVLSEHSSSAEVSETTHNKELRRRHPFVPGCFTCCLVAYQEIARGAAPACVWCDVVRLCDVKLKGT